jgi:50S ribosomal subunit-associated GTPase HflX
MVQAERFVSRLPHHLVEAFKSTLEEAAFADVIVKVADAGDDCADLQHCNSCPGRVLIHLSERLLYRHAY